MTVPTTDIKSPAYTGNNATDVYYPIPFVFSNTEDIDVYIEYSSGVITKLPDSEYTVEPGGVLTVDPWDNTHRVTLVRNTPQTQDISFIEGNKFPAATNELGLDKLTMEIQELSQKIDQCFRSSVASSTPAAIDIPSTGAFSQVMGFDDLGIFRLLTPVDVLAIISLAGSPTVRFTEVWADDAARAAKVPEFIGQVGIQLDKTGLNAFYRSTGTSAGNWVEAFAYETALWTNDASRATNVPRFTGQVGIQLDKTGIAAIYIATGTSAGNWAAVKVTPLEINGVTEASVIGRGEGAGDGDAEEITFGTGLNLTGKVLSASASAPLFSEILSVTTDSLIGRDTAGTGNAELITLGRGLKILSAALVGGSVISVDFYATSQTGLAYDADCKYAIWILQGAGGKGGDANTVSGQGSAGPGGNSGSIVIGLVDVDALTAKTCNVTIGAANGGSTSYTDDAPTTFTAVGGENGTNNTASSGLGVVPGTANSTSTGSGIFLGSTGIGKHAHLSGTNIQSTMIGAGGDGADSWFGKGGPGGYIANSGSAASLGTAGLGYGSGGGGSGAVGGSTNKSGANGANGCALRIQMK